MAVQGPVLQNGDVWRVKLGSQLVTDYFSVEDSTGATLFRPRGDGTVIGSCIKDEDNMVSDSASHIATQQSIKAYADTKAVIAHEASHIKGGSAEIDGDQLDIDYTPSAYTPSTDPAEVSNVDHLTAHLDGIDNSLGGKVSGPASSTIRNIAIWGDGAGGSLSDSPVGINSVGDVNIHEAGLMLDSNLSAVPVNEPYCTYSGIIIPDASYNSSVNTPNRLLYRRNDGSFDLAQANSSSTMIACALAISTGVGGDKKVLKQGYLRDSNWNWQNLGSTISEKSLLYAHEGIAGSLTQTAPSTSGEYSQIVGYAITSTEIYFNPDMGWVKIA